MLISRWTLEETTEFAAKLAEVFLSALAVGEFT
jgi:hypothetical protein